MIALVDMKKLEQKYGKILWTDKPHNFFGKTMNWTRFILTEKKLIICQGLFLIREENIELYRIVDFGIEMNIIDKMFGLGSVVLHCKDATTPYVIINLIKDPYSLQKILEEKVRAQQKEYGVLGKDYIGGGAAGGHH